MSEKAGLAIKKSENKVKNIVSKKPKADRSLPGPTASPVKQILYLQRTIGNRAAMRLIRSGAIQAKLKINKPNDIYEKEADQVADKVMRMEDRSLVNGHRSLVQREPNCPECKKEEIGIKLWMQKGNLIKPPKESISATKSLSIQHFIKGLIQRECKDIFDYKPPGHYCKEEKEAIELVKKKKRVYPYACFVWQVGPKGYRWSPISGELPIGYGCAHYVAHKLHIEGTGKKKCRKGWAVNVDQILIGRNEYTLQNAEVRDVWKEPGHVGVVKDVIRDENGKVKEVKICECTSDGIIQSRTVKHGSVWKDRKIILTRAFFTKPFEHRFRDDDTPEKFCSKLKEIKFRDYINHTLFKSSDLNKEWISDDEKNILSSIRKNTCVLIKNENSAMKVCREIDILNKKLKKMSLFKFGEQITHRIKLKRNKNKLQRYKKIIIETILINNSLFNFYSNIPKVVKPFNCKEGL